MAEGYVATSIAARSSRTVLDDLISDRLEKLRRNNPKTTFKEGWKTDPVLYAKERLGIELWGDDSIGQFQIAKEFVVSMQLAVRSGHKIGKTALSAVLALWFFECFENSVVVLTAPANHQIENILWPELCRLYDNAIDDIPGYRFKTPQKGIHGKGGITGSRIFSIATDEPEKVAGISGTNVCIIVDEASGYPPANWDAIFGNLAGGSEGDQGTTAKLLAIGNPTQNNGEFFNAFHIGASQWKGIRISSEDSPNVVQGKVVIPGLATTEFIEAAKERWGVNSPIYQVRVQGNFPTSSTNSVISLGTVTAAQGRHNTAVASGRLQIGVDPARFGDDDSVAIARRGSKIVDIRKLNQSDGQDVAAMVLEMVRRLEPEKQRRNNIPLVLMDEIGIGSSPYDFLKLSKDIELVGINVSERSSEPEQYNNLRAELWFKLGDWLKDDGAIPNDGRLQAELTAPLYSLDQKGRVKIEDKPSIKKKLGRSPDIAEALMCAVYTPPTSGMWSMLRNS
jgi:hypothetical protein